jgi:hypothetical protein
MTKQGLLRVLLLLTLTCCFYQQAPLDWAKRVYYCLNETK